jgi:hypothetical protein
MSEAELQIDDSFRRVSEADFSEVDREALNRALQLVLNGPDRDTAEQIRSFLEDVDQDPDHGWFYASVHAVYHLQCQNLGLFPNQEPPCLGDPCSQTGRFDANANKLMRRLISHGLSMFEPDPIAAINATKEWHAAQGGKLPK